MKIAYFGTYYPAALEAFYVKHPALATFSYKEQNALLAEEHFGVFGAYVHYAAAEGHETQLFVANCEPMQRKWAEENNVPFTDDWRFSIAAKQIIDFAPDIFFMGSMFNYYGKFIDQIKPFCKMICGWVSCPIPPGLQFNQFDLILSSAIHYVDDFRKMNVNSELLPAAFDTRIADTFKRDVTREIPCSFVGGLSNVHAGRVEMLRTVAKKTPLKIWGYGYQKPTGFFNTYFRTDSISKAFQGEAWGIDMYRIFAHSKIAFNVHIAEAKDQAGNMRMYEATGLGTLLLTDKKTAGDQLWIPGKEVVEYTSVDDAIDKINYYLKNEKERVAIANAGQKRTHEEYNFSKNIKVMLGHFMKYF